MLAMFAMFAMFAAGASEGVPTDGTSTCRCLPIVTPLYNVTTDSDIPDSPAFAVAARNSTFGVGCWTHDKVLPTCRQHAPSSPNTLANLQLCQQQVIPRPSFCDQTSKLPEFCGYPWCYVDPSQCQVYNEHSLLFPDSHRYYSYATCGYPDKFTGDVVRHASRGSILRVYYHHSSAGFIGAYHPGKEDNIRDDRWYGPYVDLIQHVASAAGFVINITVIPQHVKDTAARMTNSSSPSTHCAYAATLGYVDICVGSFTITTARTAFSRYFTITHEDSYLVVPGHGPSLWEKVRTVFVPFAPELWLWLFVSVIVVSIVFAFQERSLKDGDFEDFEGNPRGVATMLFRTVYFGLAGLLGGGLVHNAGDPGGRVTSLGLIWFFVLVNAFYTANLTTFLVTQSTTGSISSVEDAVDKRVVLCARHLDEHRLRRHFPGILLEVVPRPELLSSIDKGLCRGSIMVL